jgi:hypothetical protein
MTKDEIDRFTFARWTSLDGADTIAALSEQHLAGQRHGWTIAFFANGQKACEGQFRAGAEDGWWVFWGRDGTPRAAIEFRQGKPVLAIPGLSAPPTYPMTSLIEDARRMLKAS